MYESRSYRHWVKGTDLVPFNVVVKETDLSILASINLKGKAHRLVLKYRNMLERYIAQHPSFLTTLVPLPVGDNAPYIVKVMATAAEQVGVGPMAAIAGAIAEFVGTELLTFSPDIISDIIIENGGDIYMKTSKKRVVGIYAGKSPLTSKIGVEIEGKDTPIGICTSSGTVGHSLSFGQADAVTVLSKSATLADAAATAIGNIIKQPSDFPKGIGFAKGIDGLTGLLIIKDDKIGIWGDIKLCQT